MTDRDWADEKAAECISVPIMAEYGKYSKLRDNIAHALRDERERCAKVADAKAATFNSDETADYRDGEYLAARAIAKAIRKGTND